jgi:hypothetical protein
MANRATPARLSIDERLDTAGHLVVRARIFYEVWWFYEGAETRTKIIDTMRDYPEFFRFDAHAHFVAYTVHAAALFERRRDTINLPRLLAEIAASRPAPDPDLAEAQMLLQEAEILSGKVKVLRNNLFAHRSASLSYAGAFEEADITPNELGLLSELALKVVNRLLRVRGLQVKIFHTVPRQHVGGMLNALASASAS